MNTRAPKPGQPSSEGGGIDRRSSHQRRVLREEWPETYFTSNRAFFTGRLAPRAAFFGAGFLLPNSMTGDSVDKADERTATAPVGGITKPWDLGARGDGVSTSVRRRALRGRRLTSR